MPRRTSCWARAFSLGQGDSFCAGAVGPQLSSRLPHRYGWESVGIHAAELMGPGTKVCMVRLGAYAALAVSPADFPRHVGCPTRFPWKVHHSVPYRLRGTWLSWN